MEHPLPRLSGATARLWCPVALIALGVYLSVRMHGGAAAIPLVLIGAFLLRWVESRVLARRGHACEAHGLFLLLGVALGLWLAGWVDGAVLEAAQLRYQWPDRPFWRTALIEGGLASAIAFWFVMGAGQWLALRRQLRGAGRWIAANVAAGVVASAGIAWSLRAPDPAGILALLAAVTAAAMALALAVTRLPVVPRHTATPTVNAAV